MAKYRVVAPYVTLTQRFPQGTQVVGLGVNSIVEGDDIPEWQLRHHLDGRLIEKIEDPADPPSVVWPKPVETDADLAEAASRQALPDRGTESDRETESEGRKRPPDYGTKAAWVEWAVAHGASQEDAESSTKDSLIADYGDK